MMTFIAYIELPGFLYFVGFFLIFGQKFLIFLNRYLKNNCKNAAKKDFCQNPVWFLSYVKFSDFNYKKYALLKLVFWPNPWVIFFGPTNFQCQILWAFIWYVSPLCLGGVHGNLFLLPDYDRKKSFSNTCLLLLQNFHYQDDLLCERGLTKWSLKYSSQNSSKRITVFTSFQMETSETFLWCYEI